MSGEMIEAENVGNSRRAAHCLNVGVEVGPKAGFTLSVETVEVHLGERFKAAENDSGKVNQSSTRSAVFSEATEHNALGELGRVGRFPETTGFGFGAVGKSRRSPSKRNVEHRRKRIR